MRFITQDMPPAPAPVVAAVKVDEDGDLVLTFDGVDIGYVGHNTGVFYRNFMSDSDAPKLRAKGLYLGTNNEIKIL